MKARRRKVAAKRSSLAMKSKSTRRRTTKRKARLALTRSEFAKYYDQLPSIIRKLIAVAERLGRTTEAAKLRRLLR